MKYVKIGSQQIYEVSMSISLAGMRPREIYSHSGNASIPQLLNNENSQWETHDVHSEIWLGLILLVRSNASVLFEYAEK